MHEPCMTRVCRYLAPLCLALYAWRCTPGCASSQPPIYRSTSYIWQVRLDPHSAETYADMGTAYLARRELLASQAEYERALQLQPANALAHANLVYLRTKLCDWTGRRPRPRARPQSPPHTALPPRLTAPPPPRPSVAVIIACSPTDTPRLYSY